MTLLEELRTYLVSQGIVRLPRVAGALPPVWLEPRDGVPAPGDDGNATENDANAVVGIYLNSGIPARPYESFQRQDIVEFWLRTRTAPIAHTLEEALRTALIDKRAWQMAGMLVIETEQWRPLQLVTSDAQGYTYNLSYWFQRYR